MLELGMMVPDHTPPESSDNNTLSPHSLSSLGKHIPQKRNPADLGAINAQKLMALANRNDSPSTHEMTLPEGTSIAHQKPVSTVDNTELSVKFPHEADVWKEFSDIDDTNSGSSRSLLPAKTIEELYWANRAKTTLRTEETHLGQEQGHNIASPTIETPLDPQTTQSFITQIRNKPISDHGKNTKKSSIWKSISGPFKAVKNAITSTSGILQTDIHKNIKKTTTIVATALLALAGTKSDSDQHGSTTLSPKIEKDTPITKTIEKPKTTRQNYPTPFEKFIFEQYLAKNVQPKQPTNLSLKNTAFLSGMPQFTTTYEANLFTLSQEHTTKSVAPQENIQASPVVTASQKVDEIVTPQLPNTPKIETANANLAMPLAQESIPVVAPETTPSTTQHISKTAMFVISNQGKTITITDTNNDGLTVKEYRLGLFASIPGGNISQNTPLMYKMADKMGLDTRFIKPGHENDTLTITNIMPGVTPVTQDCTAHDGETYKITANTPEALEQAVTQLTHPDTMASSEKAHTLPPIPKMKTSGMEVPTMETIPEIPLRAIPLTEDELNELGLLPSDMDAGVLPDLHAPTLPPIPTLNIASSTETRAMEIYDYMKRNNGIYASYSRSLVPSTPQEAQEQLKNIIETWTAVNAYGMLSDQPAISLRKFFKSHYSFCTRDRFGGEKDKMVYIEDMARFAGYTDLQIARLGDKKIPPYVIDAANHDGALGTFDMDGWDQTEKLIVQAATKKYNKEPGITELMDFVKDNVSIAKYPGITYREILTKAIQERTQQLVTKGEKNMPPPLVEAKNPERENVIPTQLSSPSTPTPKKQWAWITIRSGKDEISDLQNAIQTIHQDFTVGRDMAKKEGRLFRWLTESDFAKDRYQIIDDRKENISYEGALMKISGVEHEAKK